MLNYAERRKVLANAALADSNMAPERRCIGSYYSADLSSGQIINCYAGLGHDIMRRIMDRPLLGSWMFGPGGHLVHSGGSSMSIADWYGLTYKEIDDIISMSDRKEPTEDINEYLLSRALPALAPEAN